MAEQAQERVANTGGGAYFEGNATIGGDFVGGDKIVYIEPSSLNIPSPHQLPPPPRDFTGRQVELAKLLAAVENGATTVGLYGLGGVGKTALALKLAEQLTSHYPEAQFYLDLKGVSEKPLSSADAMAHVIRAYYPTTKLPEGEAELQGLYFSVLSGKRVLLLLDNTKDAAQVMALVPPAGCFLIITSRQHFTLPGLYAKDLDTLPPAEAQTLLLNIANRIGDQANEIARLCGYLPLALRLAGSALAERKSLGVANYVQRLKNEQMRLQLVEASLMLSYHLLTPEWQRLWQLLAVFPATFDRAAAAAVWMLAPDVAQDVLDGLVSYSLLEWNEIAARYVLHDLARLFAQQCLNDAERLTAEQRFSIHYKTVLHTVKEFYRQGGEVIQKGLALLDWEWVNIQAGQKWAEAHKDDPNMDTAARLCCDYPEAGGYLLFLHQHPREHIRWREAALAAAQRFNDRLVEVEHLGKLGDAYKGLGEVHHAIELYHQRLVLARQINDRLSECKALNNLGMAYTESGEAHRAIEFHEGAIMIAREISDPLDESNALTNLGVAYVELGEARRAVELHEQALAIARKIGNRWAEGYTLGNLGSAYASLGETRRAIEFYEKRLVVAREVGNRRGEGYALGYLGQAYTDLGEFDQAIEYSEQALVIAREIGYRRQEGNALFNLSQAFAKLNDRMQTITYAEAALKIYEQIQNPRAEKVRQLLAGWKVEALL